MSTAVLAIGIDAASPALLRGWAADGTMPNLAALLARGTSGPVRGIEGFHVGSTWPSFYTATSPATHGIHFLRQLEPGTYDLVNPMHRFRESDPRPFWSLLSDAGCRLAILDVPLSRLDRGIAGIQTVEWGGHDHVFGFHASPEDLTEKVRALVGDYPLGSSCDGLRTSSEDYAAFLEALVRGARAKTDLTLALQKERSWDLLLQVYTEAHCAGHQCWHLHDATHPAYDASSRPGGEDPLRAVYAAIDSGLGRIVAEAGADWILVFSAHGMGPWYGAQFLLAEVLLRLGAATAPSPAPRRGSDVARGALGALWRTLPPALKRALQPVRRRFGPRDVPVPPSLGVDLSSSRCFVVPNGQTVGGVRVNLRGREPSGLVEPGAEAERLLGWLAAELMKVVDERTGLPAFSRVSRTAELYHGSRLPWLPDLLVHWTDALPTGSRYMARGKGALVRLSSPAIGVVEGENEYGRTGEHRSDGMFVAVGPGIHHARLHRAVALVDLAPTLCRFLGHHLRAVDGRAIPELAGGVGLSS